VDAHPADPVLCLRHHGRHGDDHLESSLSSRYFKRGLETHLLEKLAKALPIVLGIYALLKFGELACAGDLGYLFTSGTMSILFWAEILIGVFAPIVWFSVKKIAKSQRPAGIGAIIVLVGMILNRFNVSWFAVKHPDPMFYLPTFMGNVDYFPTLPEVAVSDWHFLRRHPGIWTDRQILSRLRIGTHDRGDSPTRAWTSTCRSPLLTINPRFLLEPNLLPFRRAFAHLIKPPAKRKREAVITHAPIVSFTTCTPQPSQPHRRAGVTR
jgi:hypothetical protein